MYEKKKVNKTVLPLNILHHTFMLILNLYFPFPKILMNDHVKA